MADLNVAFWNVQNLFEPRPGDPRTPASVRELDAKIARMAQVLRSLFRGEGPDLIGLCEIYSQRLLNRLIRELAIPCLTVWEPCLSSKYAHTGLAILARNERFASLTHAGSYAPHLFARPRYLIARCVLAERKEPFFFVVNHWRSRVAAEGTTAADAAGDRLETARALGTWLEGQPDDTCAVVVGDFNAEPFEEPFGPHGLDASRHSRPLLHPALYNTAWRFLIEPDPCEAALAAGPNYRASRTKTTIETYDGNRNAVSAVFDQLMVTGPAITGEPLMLQESTVDYAFDGDIGHSLDGHRRPKPWRYLGGAPSGASDHFPLIATFRVPMEAQP